MYSALIIGLAQHIDSDSLLVEDIVMTNEKGVVILTEFSKKNVTNIFRKILDED